MKGEHAGDDVYFGASKDIVFNVLTGEGVCVEESDVGSHKFLGGNVSAYGFLDGGEVDVEGKDFGYAEFIPFEEVTAPTAG